MRRAGEPSYDAGVGDHREIASFAALDHPQFNGAAAQNQGPMIGEPTRRCALGVLEDVVRAHPQSDFIVPGRGDRVPFRDVNLRRDPLFEGLVPRRKLGSLRLYLIMGTGELIS